MAVDFPSAARGDRRDLLDIDVDQLAGPFTLIARHRAGISRAISSIETTTPRARKIRCTVDDAIPTSNAIRSAPQRRFRRNRSTRARRDREVSFGDRCGRLERSNSPSLPSATNRSRHFRTVFASTWNRCAVASIVHPATKTHSTIRRRPSGVNGALGCLASSVQHEPSWRDVSLWKTHSLAGGLNSPADQPTPSRQGQRPRSSHLGIDTSVG